MHPIHLHGHKCHCCWCDYIIYLWQEKFAKLKEKVVNRDNTSTSTSDANGGGQTDSNSGAAEHTQVMVHQDSM